VFGWVTGASFVIFFLIKLKLDSMLAAGGLYIDNQLSIVTIISLLMAYLLFALASYLSARKGVLAQNKG